MAGLDVHVPQLQGLDGFGRAQLALPFAGNHPQGAGTVGQDDGGHVGRFQVLQVRVAQLAAGRQVDPERYGLDGATLFTQDRAGQGAGEHTGPGAIPDDVAGAGGDAMLHGQGGLYVQITLQQQGDGLEAGHGLHTHGRQGAGDDALFLACGDGHGRVFCNPGE